jgi:cytochrome P450
MANAYAITHDVSVYTEPDVFNPDRYVPVAEGGAGEPLPVGHFGFGQRYDKDLIMLLSLRDKVNH